MRASPTTCRRSSLRERRSRELETGAPTWRIRIGTWRIFYEIDDEKAIVFLTAFGRGVRFREQAAERF
jgi:mRNA-degrading endonuclease RelE of RelBE toxin-antitoxin system